MEFSQFNQLLQDNVANMLKQHSKLLVADVDSHVLWDMYLNNFPPGTNEIFRERREHDCGCCRHFLRLFGNVVVIEHNKPVSIWRFETNDTTYQPVINALAACVESAPIRDVFIAKEPKIGVKHSYETVNNVVHTWDHFNVELPKSITVCSTKSEASLQAKYRDIKHVFERSLKEISQDAIDTVLDLIAGRTLYKGEEWKGALTQFLALHKEYHDLSEDRKEGYCWSKSLKVGAAIGKIRNHSIGVLLSDLTKNVDPNKAVRRYESIVAPSNYKRPKAIFSKKMVEQAQQSITELGLLNSLGRRFATIDDITVNNILFANRDTLKQMNNGIFEELLQEATSTHKQFDRVEKISIENFIKDVIPRTSSIEVFLENRHEQNLVSLIAPEDSSSKTMFKWGNNYSWAYKGNMTDSMRERVKAAGGNIKAILRYSIQWNEDGKNQDDLDAHCEEPNGNHIWFENKGRRHPSTGMLDVDIIHPKRNQVAVENTTWISLAKMQIGEYKFYVHDYTHRGGCGGFRAEIEYDKQLYQYNYNKSLRQNERVLVARLRLDRENRIKFIKSLPANQEKTMWGLNTKQFHPVSMCMMSPNYWDDQQGIGNRHYFFLLKGCVNDSLPNGFFNEFLQEDLMKHKKVFAALGNKMKVPPSDNQLSGVGFSSTKKSSIVCKVEGNITRMVEVIF